MANLAESKLKDKFIIEIVNEINEIPVIYYKTIYEIIHTFRENMPNIQLENNAENYNEIEFDWDNLLNEIHLNRQKNNLLLNEKVNHLFQE